MDAGRCRHSRNLHRRRLRRLEQNMHARWLTSKLSSTRPLQLPRLRGVIWCVGSVNWKVGALEEDVLWCDAYDLSSYNSTWSRRFNTSFGYIALFVFASRLPAHETTAPKCRVSVVWRQDATRTKFEVAIVTVRSLARRQSHYYNMAR